MFSLFCTLVGVNRNNSVSYSSTCEILDFEKDSVFVEKDTCYTINETESDSDSDADLDSKQQINELNYPVHPDSEIQEMLIIKNNCKIRSRATGGIWY